MKKLNLYCISEEYINYLRKFDNKVFYNKKNSRPYVGVVFEYNNFKYFAPLSSPKPKHKLMKNSAWDIFKIADGNLGIVNINNMIPTPDDCLYLLLPNVKNISYRILLKKQLKFLIII